jgi:MFS family permease
MRDEEMASPIRGEYNASSPKSTRSKYESRDFSGSVFLISSDGRVLNLPIPTSSSRDPLNWSKGKRARAFIALSFFSMLGLVLVQGPSMMFVPLRTEFSDEVCYPCVETDHYLLMMIQDTKPFSLLLLLSAPTLFMGIGAFCWIPFSLAIGRRPVFLLCTVLMLLAIIGAGTAGNFYQLLIAVCVQGLAEGVNTSMVAYPRSKVEMKMLIPAGPTDGD